MKHRFKVWFQAVTMFFAVLSLTFASYAWFTTNREVSTSTASARTGDETLELQLSTSGGSSFQNSDTVSIQQVNQICRISYIHRLPRMEWQNFSNRLRMNSIIITGVCTSGHPEQDGQMEVL